MTKETTTLAELMATIGSVASDKTICISESNKSLWSQDSLVTLCGPEQECDGVDSTSNMHYFLEVWIANEVIEVWSSWRGGRVPNIHDTCKAVIYYARNDAYLPPDQD